MKDYSNYSNDFTYGRDRVKKLVLAAAITCVIGLVMQQYQSIQLFFVVLSTAIFAYAIYIIIKYCRCPNCGKVIFLGLLAVKTCSRCKRSLTTGQKVKKSKR